MTKSTAPGLAAQVLAMILATTPAAALAAGTSVQINATGMTSAAGEVTCALFRSSAGFPSKPERAAYRISVPIKEGTATCVFSDVPAGPAAVSVFHDANANRKLDMRFGFLPRESIGASNNPKARLGPPKFEAAQFPVGNRPVTLSVILQQP